MANQMIALQARGPQLPNLGAAAAQYGNMMANMALMKEKQAGIERANAFRQLVSDPGFDPANPEHVKLAQSLDPAGAEKIVSATDARRKAQQDYTLVEVKRLRDIGAAVGDETGYQDWLTRVEKVSPGDAAAFRQFSPNFDPDKMNRIIMTADQYINKKITTPTASVQVNPVTNALQAVTVGGLGEPSAKEIPEYRYIPDRPAQKPAPRRSPMPAAPTTKLSPPPANGPSAAFRQNFSDFVSAPPEAIDAAAEAILKGTPVNDPVLRDLSPKDFQEAQRRASRLVLDKTAFSPGGEDMGVAAVQPLTVENAPQIIQTAIQNGVIDQSHVEQLRQMVGPENDAALAQWMRQNNVRIQPAGEPSLRSAVYRPGQDVAPQMQQIGYEPTGRAAQGKPPMQSPMPGTAIVPLPRVRKQAAAEEGGKQGVRVATEPVIAGSTKTAELQAQKDMAFPDAQAQFESALAAIDNRIEDIERFRKHPAANRVIGPLDAFTPNVGRARGAQALYDALVATATLDELQQMRQNSPTGGALGNVSDADIRLLRQSIGALAQSQMEEDFYTNLKVFEARLRQTRDRLARRFRENYGYKLGKNWQPPAAPAQPAPATGRRAGGFTVMQVED